MGCGWMELLFGVERWNGRCWWQVRVGKESLRLSGILVLMSEASHGVHGKQLWAVSRKTSKQPNGSHPFASPLGVVHSGCSNHLTLFPDDS